MRSAPDTSSIIPALLLLHLEEIFYPFPFIFAFCIQMTIKISILFHKPRRGWQHFSIIVTQYTVFTNMHTQYLFHCWFVCKTNCNLMITIISLLSRGCLFFYRRPKITQPHFACNDFCVNSLREPNGSMWCQTDWSKTWDASLFFSPPVILCRHVPQGNLWAPFFFFFNLPDQIIPEVLKRRVT